MTPPFGENFLGKLNARTEELDEQLYQDYIDDFGTHYVVKIRMGGTFGEQSFMTESSKQSLESEGFSVAAAASASGLFASVKAAGSVETASKAAQSFRNKSFQRSICTSGSPYPADGSALTLASNVFDDIQPIFVELERIDELPLPVSSAVKANLARQMDNYCQSLVEAAGMIETCGEFAPTATTAPTFASSSDYTTLDSF